MGGGSPAPITGIIRRFLVKLICDVVVEFYARTKVDPLFLKKISDAFTTLDGPTTKEGNDAAAKAIQDAISS